MKIPRNYQVTPKISRLLVEINDLSEELGKQEPNKILLKYHRRRSILKSSLFSARIEGNKFDKSNLNSISSLPQSQSKFEITNLVKAIEAVEERPWDNNLSISDIKYLHSLVMANIENSAGHLRIESSAIFNSAGVAIYMCPPPGDLQDLMTQLIQFINEDNFHPSPIRVALVHYAFEKIHPFLDGNGRVGRVLIHLLMKKYGYSLHGLFGYEEYIDKHRDDYYDLLSSETADITDFVEYILEAFVSGLRQSITLLLESPPLTRENLLLPRRQELLALIGDHPLSSFDFIQRRFMAIPSRTLRYDLKYLKDHEFINKLGSTKGVLYSPKNDKTQ